MATPNQVRADFDSLTELVWKQIDYKRLLVGRRVVRNAVRLYVCQWPTYTMANTESQDRLCQQLVEVGTEAFQTNPRGKKYGFFWTFLLSAVLSQVVQALLKWWLERDENRESLIAMKTLRGEQ
jgi:hypothetical protein